MEPRNFGIATTQTGSDSKERSQPRDAYAGCPDLEDCCCYKECRKTGQEAIWYNNDRSPYYNSIQFGGEAELKRFIQFEYSIKQRHGINTWLAKSDEFWLSLSRIDTINSFSQEWVDNVSIIASEWDSVATIHLPSTTEGWQLWYLLWYNINQHEANGNGQNTNRPGFASLAKLFRETTRSHKR